MNSGDEPLEVLVAVGEDGRWSPGARLALHIAIIYLVLFTAPLLSPIVPWFAEAVLGLEAPVVDEMTGSGDPIFGYVAMLLAALLGVGGGVVWTTVDRTRGNPIRRLYWLSVGVRYFLAGAMAGYGLGKLFPLQFGEISFVRLIDTYGNSSPMGLLWTFMAFSPAYTMFTGAIEVGGGLLLCFRRTATLGGLLVSAVMANVVMLNLCYDVPVKRNALHMLAMAVFVVALDHKRLTRLVRGMAVPGLRYRLPFKRAWTRRARVALKLALIGKLYVLGSAEAVMMMREYGRWAHEPPLYGLYEVESFVRNAVPIPAIVGDDDRWQAIAFEKSGRSVIVGCGGGRQWYATEVDEVANVIRLRRRAEDDVLELAYDNVGGRLELTGRVGDATIRIVARKRHRSEFTLFSRPFRWVTATPFNR